MTQDEAAWTWTLPELTLGWRLKMALDSGGVTAREMADRLGVTRQTISRWMGDKGRPPHLTYLRAWAEYTDVPFGWLDSGEHNEQLDRP